MIKHSPNIMIMAGGTGGHVFPGLAIAQALRQKGAQVSWLGSINGMENQLVPQAGFELFTLAISGLRGKSWQKQLFIPWQLAHAVYQAVKILRQQRPDVVLGMGGFAAGPGGIAARLLGIPLVIHEQNSIAGLTNRCLAKIASQVLCAFPNTFPRKIHALTTGNPVRKAFEAIPPPNERIVMEKKRKTRLLILGGSRGAQALNTTVPEAIALLPEESRPEIQHQTGRDSLAATQKCYAALQISANVVPFIDEISHSYAWADVIVCRAGALTLAELTCVGVAAILIPYPHAVDDHQTVNAQFLTKNNAAILLPQPELSANNLSILLRELLNDPKKRLAMANASRKLRQESATEKIIEVIFGYLNI
jgi:UDP-N-acetylglucosamine--N-acetylmuramyl-(pentapeptide) pyrophosphoryl-undecaprenol N-acetylglucosamine transferase